jgi:uncharacterized membrane protein YdjX (TVP38/TMEM64 family)
MKKKIIILVLIILAILLVWIFDVFSLVSLDRIDEMSNFIDSLGIWAPIAFITLYIMATVLFVPGLPLTLLAGIAFGPVLGSIWVSIASTIGASLAFLVGRFIGRDLILARFGNSDIFKKLDEGIKNQGWKMIAITRLMPLFPFNAQNYVYGLTDVPFKTYVLISWICMLPATIGYVFLAGAIVGGEGNAVRTISYVGIGVAVLMLLSLGGKFLGKRQNNLRNNNKDKKE